MRLVWFTQHRFPRDDKRDTPYSGDKRDTLHSERLADATYLYEMEQAVQNYGTSLLNVFDWGTLSEHELYLLSFDCMQQKLIDNFNDHVFRSDAGLEYVSVDGLCQLTRDHCRKLLGIDMNHPYDRRNLMCVRSLCKLKDGRYSAFCLLHKGDNEEAEVAELLARDQAVMAHDMASREKSDAQTVLAYNKVSAIVRQIASAEQGPRQFMVSWEGRDPSDLTRETETVLAGCDAFKAWEAAQKQRAERGVEGRVGAVAEAATSSPPGAGGAGPGASDARGAAPFDASLCQPCNPRTADQIVLDVDNAELTGRVCVCKDFGQGEIVSKGKVRFRSMMKRVPVSEGGAAASESDEDDADYPEEDHTGAGDEETDDEEEDDKEIDGDAATGKAAAGVKRKRGGGGASGKPAKYRKSTTGTLWMHHKDGYPAPHMEMLMHEGDTMVMNYFHTVWAREARLPRYIGYDNMVGPRHDTRFVFSWL